MCIDNVDITICQLLALFWMHPLPLFQRLSLCQTLWLLFVKKNDFYEIIQSNDKMYYRRLINSSCYVSSAHNTIKLVVAAHRFQCCPAVQLGSVSSVPPPPLWPWQPLSNLRRPVESSCQVGRLPTSTQLTQNLAVNFIHIQKWLVQNGVMRKISWEFQSPGFPVKGTDTYGVVGWSWTDEQKLNVVCVQPCNNLDDFLVFSNEKLFTWKQFDKHLFPWWNEYLSLMIKATSWNYFGVFLTPNIKLWISHNQSNVIRNIFISSIHPSNSFAAQERVRSPKGPQRVTTLLLSSNSSSVGKGVSRTLFPASPPPSTQKNAVQDFQPLLVPILRHKLQPGKVAKCKNPV